MVREIIKLNTVLNRILYDNEEASRDTIKTVLICQAPAAIPSNNPQAISSPHNLALSSRKCAEPPELAKPSDAPGPLNGHTLPPAPTLHLENILPPSKPEKIAPFPTTPSSNCPK